jgi:hypothetical protein
VKDTAVPTLTLVDVGTLTEGGVLFDGNSPTGIVWKELADCCGLLPSIVLSVTL